MVLRERPDWTIVRPVLALTVYLERETEWARRWAAELFASFRARPFAAALRWSRSSITSDWRPTRDDLAIQDALSNGSSPRHLLRLRIADDPNVPNVAFTYREVDPSRARRAGYVQLVIPIDSDPDELLALAIEVAQQADAACMIGGPALVWNEELPRNSFDAIYRLCKRFAGIDVQLPDEANAFAKRRLPSVAWLTFVGNRMMALHGMSPRELVPAPTSAGVSTVETRTGLVFRAGAVPELGDINAMEDPVALRALTRHLAAFLIGDDLSFPGRFRGEPMQEPADHTSAWRTRLVDPERW